MDCACTIKEEWQDRLSDPTFTIVYCPMHAAAPVLRNAALEAADYLDLQSQLGASFMNLRTGIDRLSIVVLLRAAIAKAELRSKEE